MTYGDFRKTDELLTAPDIFSFAERLCKKHNFDPEAAYPKTDKSDTVKSDARLRLYVGRTIKLLRYAILLGASVKDVLAISRHLMTLTKAFKNSLDFRRSENDNKISKLGQKYNSENLMQLDISLDDLKTLIKSVNNYYGVELKCE